MSAFNTFRRVFAPKTKTYRHPKAAPRPRLAVQPLEARSLMAASLTASLDLNEGVFRVEGTDDADQVRILHQDGTLAVEGISITLTDLDGTVSEVPAVDRGSVGWALIETLGGDDAVSFVEGAGAADTPLVTNVYGGEGNDTLEGGSSTDALFGENGDDDLAGWAGDDLIYGGDGNDQVAGGEGNDYLAAEWGDDVVTGAEGDDTISGGDGADAIYGGDGDDVLAGEYGADVVDGQAGNDAVQGAFADGSGAEGDEANLLFGGEGDDTLGGGDAADYMDAGPGMNVVNFGPGDQVIEFTGGSAVTVSLSGRNLTVDGTPGADNILVRENGGRVSVFTVAPDNSLTLIGNRDYGPAELDRVFVRTYGGADRVRVDTTTPASIRGGEGDDTLYGSHGPDYLYGENGNDRLYGAPNGEDGYESAANSNDALWGGDGNDTMFGGYGNDQMVGENGSDEVHGQWGNDLIVGSNWDRTSSVPNAAEVGPSNDFLYGENGNDTMFGGYGDDQMSGGWDNDLMYGEYGNDKMWGAFSNSPAERAGSTNNDTMYGGNGNDTLRGGVGEDWLYGEAQDDGLYGEDGNDRLSGLDGSDSLDGGAGQDVVGGGNGNDTLHGGAGEDQLNGGGGADDLYGDAGDDALIAIDAVAADRLFADAGRDTLWVDEVSAGLGTTASVTDPMYGVDATFDRVQRVRAFANGADRTLDGDAIADPDATVDPFGNSIAADYRNFRTNPLFADAGPRRGDVVQQNRGDCWIMATAAGTADRSPWNVRSLVADAGDGTYLVRLGANFYRVDADLPTGGAWGTSPRNAGLGAQNSLWVAVVEKAYAHFRTNGANHSYRSLDNGDSQDAARAFNLGSVGQQAYGTLPNTAGGISTFGTAAALGNQIRTQWNAGRIVTVCTDGVLPAGSPLVANHCWAVTGFTTDIAGNVSSINLRNPWGSDLTVSVANMFAAGVWVTWGTP